MIEVAEVMIDSRSAGLDAIYHYLSVPGAQRGQARIVPLGQRSEVGFIRRISSVDPDSLGFPAAKLKTLGPEIDGLGLAEPTLDLVEFVSSEFLCPITVALRIAIPPGFRDRVRTVWGLVAGSSVAELTPNQAEVISVIRDQGGKLIEGGKSVIPASSKRALQNLLRKGIVSKRLELQSKSERSPQKGPWKLTPDSNAVEEFLRNLGKKRPAQALTLMNLQSSEDTSFSTQELKALCGVTDATVRALVTEGLLVPEGPTNAAAPLSRDLKPAQASALDRILPSVREQRYEKFLLYGVTGSGKTEVYLNAASEAIRLGRQVLYLVPEIALTTQVVSQLRERFGQRIAVLHSNLSASERMENWLRIGKGEAAVVLGARSALFAPIQNLGMIIVDEEHESSYKQESAPRYHLKPCALALAQVHGCPIVLGSATPSFESYHDAQKGKIALLEIPERAAAASMPAVEIVDLTQSFKLGSPALFSQPMLDGLQETLDRGEQALIFLNRRAYSPFLLCRDCGHSFVCPSCSVTLSWHRRDARLKCHYCGYQTVVPDLCPQCAGNKVAGIGVGAEKVEESVQLHFPSASVERLDSDIAKRKGALESILARFRAGEIQILVGTQMIAKGLDFPNVTFVGVVAADISLNLPDFRSSERTYRLLSQVSGRAGRGQKPGRVVIQTFNPDHAAIRWVPSHDFARFFEEIIPEREAAHYPPFVRLVNIVISSESRTQVIAASERGLELLSAAGSEAEVLGPVDCPLERLNKVWRRHLLVKMPPDAKANWIREALERERGGPVQWLLDVDPQSLL